MAINGTGSACWASEKAARAAARTAFMADKSDRVLTAAEIDELIDQMETAGRNAFFAHLTATAVVAVASVSGVTTGAGVSGPGLGSIT